MAGKASHGWAIDSCVRRCLTRAEAAIEALVIQVHTARLLPRSAIAKSAKSVSGAQVSRMEGLKKTLPTTALSILQPWLQAPTSFLSAFAYRGGTASRPTLLRTIVKCACICHVQLSNVLRYVMCLASSRVA